MNRNRAHLLLLLTSVIWGLAFVAQVSGGKFMNTFALNFHRNLVAGLFLLVILLFIPKIRGVGTDLKATLVGGTICGVVLSVAMALQQQGLQYTTAGKGGFITALYIILVPIGGILLHHDISKKTWLSVFIAAIGLYFISVPKGGDGAINFGDILIFISAIGFATHILIIDHFSDRVDGVAMSCVQFFVAAFMSFIYTIPTGYSIVENYDLALPAILYLGLLSSGVGFTLQIVGQHYSEPTVVSLILSSEAVFGLIGGIFILGEVVTPREWVGCALMFVAILIAQVPIEKFLKFREKQEERPLS